MNPDRCRPRALTAVALLCGMAGVAPAGAQSSPWYVGAAQGFTYENNLYRLGRDTPTPAGLSRSDTVSTTSLLAGIDQPISRQRLFGNVSLRTNRYLDNTQQNNQGYGLNLGLDWATIERLTGNLNFSANQSLARFNANEFLTGIETRHNIEDARQFGATVAIGVVTRLSAEATYNWRSVRYSAPEYAFRENDQSSLSAGLRYRPSGVSSFSAGLRQTRGEYPRFGRTVAGDFIADSFRRNDLYLNADWTPGGASSADARLSFGRTAYDVATERNLSGVSGALGWNWRPTGKLKFRTALSRDSGIDSYFFDTGLVNGVADYSRSTTALRLRVDYEVSAKIGTHATLTQSSRSLTHRATPAGGTPIVNTGSDRGTALAIGASWAPTRNTQLSCDLSQETRSGAATLSVPLSIGTVGCFGQILLR